MENLTRIQKTYFVQNEHFHTIEKGSGAYVHKDRCKKAIETKSTAKKFDKQF